MSNIKVILLKNTANLGQKGDIVMVKLGYARNYLLPYKIAAFVLDPVAKELLAQKSAEKKALNKKQLEQKALLSSFIGKKLTFKLKANKEGKTFGAIYPKDIAEKLKISQDLIKTKPLKSLGEHEVIITVSGKETKIKVEINPEKEKK